MVRLEQTSSRGVFKDRSLSTTGILPHWNRWIRWNR